MKRRLGISIYPEKSTFEMDSEYIKLAHKHGFKRIFTCLLSAKDEKSVIEEQFTKIIKFAKDLDFEVILDIAPAVFADLGISYDDLSFFAKLGASGIRLDLGFDGRKEADLTCNPYDLDIELNMSNDVDYLNNIITHKPINARLIGCHNFYPQKLTALPYDFFIECSKRFKKYGLRTAAFVNSQSATIGPWDINDGLCTLEMHRNLPITTQAKHLWATGLIDDVIIGNAYASEEELEALGKLNPYLLELDITFDEKALDIEKTIVLDEMHFRRGDISEYMVRSTEVRKKYKNYDFPQGTIVENQKGHIVIGNNDFGKYKGELQVILKDMPLDTRKNLVGKVVDHELFLVDFIGAWDKFYINNSK